MNVFDRNWEILIRLFLRSKFIETCIFENNKMTLITIIIDKMSVPHHCKMADVSIHWHSCNNYWKCAAVSYLSIINTKTGIKVTKKRRQLVFIMN